MTQTPVLRADPAPEADTGIAVASSRRRGRTRSRSVSVWSLVFLAPALLAFAYFAWGPIAGTALLSFQRTNLVAPPTWVGLDNFAALGADPLVWQALRNTAVFTALTITVTVPLAVVVAVVMSELRHLGWVYRTLVYLPAVIPPVVGVLLWRYFYQPDSGIFNAVLAPLGIGPIPWLQDAATALPSLVLQYVWADLGGAVIIYIATLTIVDRQLYEAAELDGAGILRRFWHVTLPQMRATILVVLLLQLLGTFQVFTEPYVMTNGGPVNSTVTVLLLIYRYAFEFGQYGRAAALSLVFAIILAIFSVIYLKATQRWSTR
ncbi:carbohydrate ABC transporter permease [Microbacterium testaceum]|uniref:ABC transporter permease n=1 Tax=Microbacterium testaceum TaxID=2033 RepID=A0A147F898_MICTE|nr:sugar ABC transporter permease [Microbacterium testaceum]KTS12806.1 ABC transporter permease [Microbacterium testaceum]KTS90605.1 ABC transporter permease [Microbacterium testaceum]